MKAINLPRPFFFESGEKAVLLLHAYTGSANDMRLLGRELERNGYTVYAPNFTGHATERFEDILDLGSPEVWFADVMRAKEELLKRGYKNVAVFGLSMGGIMAARALETEAFIGGGSFNSPIFKMGESNVPKMFMYYARMFKKKMDTPNEVIERELDAMKPKLANQLRNMDDFTDIIQNDLDKITVPYYIAQSGKDEMIDSDCGGILAEHLRNTNVDYNWFPEATHVITIGKDRKEFELTVLDFLSRLNWNEG